MVITYVQREQRRKHLGSSDMAAVLGLDPWRNAYDVFLDKTGQLTDAKESAAMYLGTKLESGVLEFAEEKLGKLIKNQYRSAQGFPIGSNIDALVVEAGEPVEAKTSGILGPLADNWGDDGTDEVPDRVIVQAHCHMICTNKKVCHVPALLGGKGFKMFHVHWDQTIAGVIMDKSLDFWENFVEKGIEPPDVIPSIEVIKRRIRVPKKTVPIAPTLVIQWQNAKDSAKLAEQFKKDAEEQLLAALGDAEAGECELGIVTYFEQGRDFLKQKDFIKAFPALWEQYKYRSTWRVPRLKQPKKKSKKFGK